MFDKIKMYLLGLLLGSKEKVVEFIIKYVKELINKLFKKIGE